MKFFHLSDLHIGLRLINRDLSEDQTYILEQIVRLAGEEKPDAIVIAGDIYDKAIPSAEAVELFDRFIFDLTQAVPMSEIMVISGNHDSAVRVNAFRNVLKHQRVHMIGMPPVREEDHIEKVVLTDEYGPVNFWLLPFVKPSMVRRIVGQDKNGNNYSYDETLHKLIERETIEEEERNVLVSHQFYVPVGADSGKIERMESETRTVGNIDEVRADILEKFDYAALGHIHKPMEAGSAFYRYCGTPLACSVSEAGQQKGIILVSMEKKGEVDTKVLPLVPLREVRVITGTLEEILKQGCGDYVRVVLTDRVDFDVIDMQDRVRYAFPNLLEIRRETVRMADYGAGRGTEPEMDTFSLCMSFLKDLDEEEQELLQDVINSVQGRGR